MGAKRRDHRVRASGVGESIVEQVSTRFDLEREKIQSALDQICGEYLGVLPPSIAHYDDYQGIWISNSDLEPYGLARGSLAIVVPEEIRRGDLVALTEVDSDSVSCGFYDCDFGIVCLEAGGSEPQLFDKSNVRLLGRIVGVSNAKKNADGTMEVRPLNL